ncbi:speckle-type POZ protein B-like isoform X2 [Phymastichus coffea]|nr:speckle-type POZ protein B-like isoform X2 [Phymastichus coffea]
MNREYPISSPIFYETFEEVLGLQLCLCPFNHTSNKEYFSLYLFLYNYDFEQKKQLSYQIHIIDSQGKIFSSVFEKASKLVLSSASEKGRHIYTIETLFIQKNDILDEQNGLLIDDKFTINFSIDIVNTTVQKIQNYNALSKDLEQLVESNTFSDVVLVISNIEIPAHKSILAARSSVFNAIFTHNTKENIADKIIIKNMKLEIFREFLRFLYTGSIDMKLEQVHEILAAADQYAVNCLKTVCERRLLSEMKIENVIEFLLIADKYNVKDLKDEAIGFITEHSHEVINLPEFVILSKPENINLLAEAFKALALKVN